MKCSRCGAPDVIHSWDLKPCASERPIRVWLCTEHDIELNLMVLNFANVPNAEALVAAYRART